MAAVLKFLSLKKRLSAVRKTSTMCTGCKLQCVKYAAIYRRGEGFTALLTTSPHAPQWSPQWILYLTLTLLLLQTFFRKLLPLRLHTQTHDVLLTDRNELLSLQNTAQENMFKHTGGSAIEVEGVMFKVACRIDCSDYECVLRI